MGSCPDTDNDPRYQRSSFKVVFSEFKLLGKTTHSKRNRVLNKQAPMKKNSSITYPQTKNK